MQPVGFTAKELQKQQISLRAEKTVETMALDALENVVLVGFQVLHDKFGFGKKRLSKFDSDVNYMMSEEHAEEESLKCGNLLNQKYKISVYEEVKKIPFSETTKFIKYPFPFNPDMARTADYQVRKCITAYFVLSIVELREVFKFSIKQLYEFMDWVRYYVNSIAKEYVDFLGIASVLHQECNWDDPRFLGKYYEV